MLVAGLAPCYNWLVASISSLELIGAPHAKMKKSEKSYFE